MSSRLSLLFADDDFIVLLLISGLQGMYQFWTGGFEKILQSSSSTTHFMPTCHLPTMQRHGEFIFQVSALSCFRFLTFVVFVTDF